MCLQCFFLCGSYGLLDERVMSAVAIDGKSGDELSRVFRDVAQRASSFLGDVTTGVYF